jgi:7-keto-8-aminopelargonate synthetase-like enzyme
MRSGEFYANHLLDEEVALKAGFNPYYKLLGSSLGDPVVINGREYINLASNNYLGLSNHPDMIQAAIEGIREYGVSMCATPVAAGYSELFREAESALSEFVALDDAVIFPSCYQANNGLFQAITGPDDIVVVDRCVHSSLVEGIRTAGCKYRPFRHNDMNHLEEILMRTQGYRTVFVVTESVFSTEGSLAPVNRIHDLCREYDAVPIVDDSHGIGVIGASGKGVLEHFGIIGFTGIYTASLGKALGTVGGMVAGKASLIRYLRFSTSHLIYSTAVMPSALKALLASLKIIKERFGELRATLLEYTRLLSDGLNNSGYPLTDSTTPITSICSGDPVRTLKMAKLFFDAGLFTTPFIYPSVPVNQGRIRLITGANLKRSSVLKAVGIFSELKNQV